MSKNCLKKSLSWICMITMTVMTMGGMKLTDVSADTETTIIQPSDGARAFLMDEIANPEYNFALNKTAAVSKLTTTDGGSDLGILTNGAFSTTNSAATIIEIGRGSSEPAWLEVDLGKAYDTAEIDRVAVQYKTANSCPKTQYSIQYSLNGIDYVDVADVQSVSGGANYIYLDKMSLTGEQKEEIPYARYVRIYSTTNTSAYGLQVKGIAVLTDGETKVDDVSVLEIEEPDNPASLTVTSSDYEQIEYIFEGAQGHEDYLYYAYIDGVRVENAVLPNQEYKATGFSEGEHEVKIVSFKDGAVSSGITQSVSVKDFRSLLTNERNIAIGQTATASSNRGEANDIEAHITDGNTTTLFRTATSDAEASIVIDLGKNYKPDMLERVVMLFANDRYPTEYTVECSEDGDQYQQMAAVSEVSDELSNASLDMAEYPYSTVKYVKINMSKAVAAAYGFQVYEIAVIQKYINIADTQVTYEQQWEYSGEEILPEVEIQYEDTALEQDKDYTLTYSENKNTGNGKILIEGMGRFTGTEEKNFTISPRQMSNVSITVKIDSEGNLVIEAVNGTETLQQGIDYEYSTDMDENANLLITLTGTGENYTGSVEKMIPVSDIPVNDAEALTVKSEQVNEIVVSFSNPDKIGAAKQTYDIYIDDRLMDEAVSAGEYRYTEQTAGTHIVKVTAALGDKKTEGVTQEIAVAGKALGADNIEILQNDNPLVYSGEEQTLEIAVKWEEEILLEGKDYLVEYTDNIHAGTGKYKITGIGLYEGSVEGEFAIEPKELSGDDITVKTEFDAKKELVVTVTDKTKALVKGTDYDYTVQTDAEGNITVTITALKGDYTGTLVQTISAKDNPNAVTPTTPPESTGNITGNDTGNDTGNSTGDIKVAKVKKVKVKNLKGRKIKVSWKKQAGVTGYQIRYAKNAKLKKAKIKKIKKNIKSSILKNLKKKKVYYVQVRAYRVAHGKTYYGKWSVKKKLKIKK